MEGGEEGERMRAGGGSGRNEGRDQEKEGEGVARLGGGARF